MNKIVFFIFMLIAGSLIGYNLTQVDFNDPFNGQSTVALICIVAALCAIVLLVIFMISKKIQGKIKE
ncbi:hypothetical protein MWU65_00895 [Cellulophaga sp. F20128]|uniref:hypothetical protein n=1 Tax=Cellulophaga sp. F20128 TaxID=2926413 RepID=UPI001FF61B05|nr:hypothetical protein [Cellulophaga sp. F20128]MCK0155716.1 hypothetical protein [Cellulophaga sp. F20128]